MSWGLRYFRLEGSVEQRPPEALPPPGAWLVFYNPNAHDGRGVAHWSLHARDALRFDTPTRALDFWRQVSDVKPVRGDGEPNRPLTAFTVMVERL